MYDIVLVEAKRPPESSEKYGEQVVRITTELMHGPTLIPVSVGICGRPYHVVHDEQTADTPSGAGRVVDLADLDGAHVSIFLETERNVGHVAPPVGSPRPSYR